MNYSQKHVHVERIMRDPGQSQHKARPIGARTYKVQGGRGAGE